MPVILPGDAFRLVVISDDGRSSSTWRFWSSKNSDDFYFSQRETSTDFKVSYHPEIDTWRIAMTREGARNRQIDRVLISEWTPLTDESTASIIGPTITIPEKDLLTSSDSFSKETHVIRIPPGVEAIKLNLFLSDLDPSKILNIEPTALVYFIRSGGGTAYIVPSSCSLTSDAKNALDIARGEHRSNLANVSEYRAGRFVYVSELPDLSYRGLFDLSATEGRE